MMQVKLRVDSGRYAEVRECIYCGSEEQNLTDEHIIPFGLGGKLVLPKSSCKSCAKITSQFEMESQRAHYGGLRALFGFPSRKKGFIRKATMKAMGNSQASDVWAAIDVDGGMIPPSMPVVSYDPAGLLYGLPKTDFQPRSFRERIIAGSYHYKLTQLTNSFPGQMVMYSMAGVQGEAHARLIAKIAHSYAIASGLPKNAFRPLPELILHANPTVLQQCVGTSMVQANEPNSLHYLSKTTSSYNGLNMWVVRVTLFAFLGGLTYDVVVGVDQPISFSLGSSP